MEGSMATSRLWDGTWRPGVIRRHDNRGWGKWAAVCRGGWARPAEPRRAGKVNQEHRPAGGGRTMPSGPPGRGSLSWGRAPLCPAFGSHLLTPQEAGPRGNSNAGGGGRVQELQWREERWAASWRAWRGPVQTPAPRDLDMELRSAPGASLSSPVKWGWRHLPGRDRTRALGTIQARKGSETAQLLPFRSGQPVAASSRKPS